jgi:hypothetical protein
MNSVAILFLLLNAAALLRLPRRWAFLPLLVGACYMTGAQSLDLGPFHFTVLRVLLLLGVVRVLVRNERLPGGIIGLDWVLLIWGFWLLCSSLFHEPFLEALVFRLGAVYNTLGFYFLLRVFCQTSGDLTQLIKLTAFLLVPVAIEMINEKLTGRNLFAILGGVPEMPEIRNGKFRAQGPFGHSILAGTVGAVCVPLMIGIWQQHKLAAKTGLAACLGMVIASKSSGPLMTMALGVFGLMLWRWRYLTRQMCVAAIIGYFLIGLFSSRPAYYALLNRVDLTGSSTGWHRAELISQSISHLKEWWLAGTDYTRHWMPYGVSWSPDHCDITNHYLFYGVWGGLPLMFLFICMFWVAFRYVGQSLRLRAKAPFDERFLIWSLGAGLFAQAVTCISVAYFEQSVMVLYLNLAAIGSLRAASLVKVRNNASLASNPVLVATSVEPDLAGRAA